MNLRKHLGAAILIVTGGLLIGTSAQAHSSDHGARLYDRDDYCPVHGHAHHSQHSHGRHYTSHWKQPKHHRHGYGDRYDHHPHRYDRDGRDERHHDSSYGKRDGRQDHASRGSGISYTGRL
jgi:hypothetical protein